jgi:hypothetical protein
VCGGEMFDFSCLDWSEFNPTKRRGDAKGASRMQTTVSATATAMAIQTKMESATKTKEKAGKRAGKRMVKGKKNVRGVGIKKKKTRSMKKTVIVKRKRQNTNAKRINANKEEMNGDNDEELEQQNSETEDPPLQFHELSVDEQRAYSQLQEFFNTTDIIDTWIKAMNTKEQENNSMFSGRLLDFCLTNYVKDHDARYFLLFDKRKKPIDANSTVSNAWKGARPSTFYETMDEMFNAARLAKRELTHDDWMEFDLMSEYKMMIRRHRKFFFDLFRRGPKFNFEYLTADGQTRSTITTFCQLTFFRWAACFQLHSYWQHHHLEVRTHYHQLSEEFGNINARKKETVLYSRAYSMKQIAKPIRSYDCVVDDAIRGNVAMDGAEMALTTTTTSSPSLSQSFKMWQQRTIGAEPVFENTLYAQHSVSLNHQRMQQTFHLLPSY